MKLPPGQRRFNDVGNIHRAVAAIHEHLQLVHKENDIGTFLHRFNNIPQAFFQFAPIFSAGDHISQLKGKDDLILQEFRHFLFNDPLRQSFRHRRFAYTGFTDQHRIIFRPTAQDPHQVF